MEPIAKNKIKAFRRERRMKQNTLAQKVGVFQSEISEIENGKRKPSVYLALKIAGVLGKNINDIF